MEGVEQDNAENHSPQTKGAEKKCIDAKMTDAEVDKAGYMSQAEQVECRRYSSQFVGMFQTALLLMLAPLQPPLQPVSSYS